MNDLQLIDLVAETNPYPPGTPLPDLVSSREEEAVRGLAGRSEAAGYDRTPRGKNRRWSGALVAAAAFVAVLVAVGIGVALRSQPPDVVDIPAPPFESPQEAAEAYLAAWEAGDFAAYLALWSPGGGEPVIGFGFGSDLPVEKARERFIADYGGQVESDIVCEPVRDVTVECTYLWSHPELSRILPGEGLLSFTRRFTIDAEGRLAYVTIQEGASSLNQTRASNAWEAWLNAEHPQIAADHERIFFFRDMLDGPVEDFRADYLAALDEYAATLEP